MIIELPKLPYTQALLNKADAHPMWEKILPSIILAAGTGITAYKDRQHGLVQTEAERLTWAIEQAAQHFTQLAATYKIG